MDRRRFIIRGICGAALGTAAGCMDAEESDNPDDGPSATGDHREVRVEADALTREADNQIVENGAVSIILELRNISTEPAYAAVTLQMRDREGNPLGSEYTRQHGPIAPEESAELRFDVEEAEDEIGGYELVVTEGEPNGDSETS